MSSRRVPLLVVAVVLLASAAFAVGTAAGTPAAGTLAADQGDASTADDNFTATVETAPVIVKNASQNYTVSVDGADGNVSATWTFENESKRGTTVSHEFDDAGNETIEVVVEDESGATVTKSLTVEVVEYDGETQGMSTSKNIGTFLLWVVPFFAMTLAFLLYVLPKGMQVLADAL